VNLNGGRVGGVDLNDGHVGGWTSTAGAQWRRTWRRSEVHDVNLDSGHAVEAHAEDEQGVGMEAHVEDAEEGAR
jgi:hypothetical protein